MIIKFVQIIESWPMFIQFLFMTFTFYFTFHIINKVISKTMDFASEALPIIIRGWPVGFDINTDTDVDGEGSNKEEDKNNE